MNPTATSILLNHLATLRTELVDLAYDLDVSGACAAADVAMTTSARLAELCAEFTVGPDDTALIALQVGRTGPVRRERDIAFAAERAAPALPSATDSSVYSATIHSAIQSAQNSATLSETSQVTR